LAAVANAVPAQVADEGSATGAAAATAPTEKGIGTLRSPSPPSPAASPAPPSFAYRGDRLEYALASLCQRGGLIGAVVADGKGLPLADFQSPVGGDRLAAFTSVLGDALERAGQLLGAQGADVIAMDLNYTDKVVLRRFSLDQEPYFLLVVCSQDLDERAEVELSIEQITAILTQE